MTHLEVKSDGLIYLIKDCPEEPKYTDFVQHIKYYWQVNKFERAKRDYQKALTSCERILCADQEQAKRLICKNVDLDLLSPLEPQGFKLAYAAYHAGEFIYNKNGIRVIQKYDDKWVELDSGIYSIPNVEFTINAECPTWCSDCKYFDWSTCRDKYIVILKESTPSPEQESQEELWFDVARTMDAHSEMHRIPILIKQFTIIRNK